MRAIALIQIPIIKALIEAKADLEIIGGDGQTAASMAAEYGNAEIIQLLREAGAKI